MTPAKPQPTLDFHRTGAVQPRPLKRQDSIQRTIGEGQQFLAGDHRHRAAVGNGLVRWRRRIPLRIRRHRRHIIHTLFLRQHYVLPRSPAHLHRALLQPSHRPANRHRFVAVHRPHERCEDRQHTGHETHG